MSNLVKIDTKILSDEITKLNDVISRMDNLFSSIRKNTESLSDVWESKTSDKVFNEFNDFYKMCDNIKDNYINDSKFLVNVVKSCYENFERDLDSFIDSNISIKE